MDSYSIAVILTCFNRKEKTLSCLRGLYSAQDAYNHSHLLLSVFLTDDGCTDGTAQAVRASFPSKEITIIQGDGSLYWAGGMRLAWNEALRQNNQWDFFLLLNDDTIPMDNLFVELFNAHYYCQNTFDKVGIYSGVTCDKENPNLITYGGTVWTNRFLGTDRRVMPQDTPQEVDKTNANILLVPQDVVSAIGIFYEGYRHGAADYDYAIQAKKQGFKALITTKACGICERDHMDRKSLRKKILAMSAQERQAFFSHPLHSSKDILLFKKRNTPVRYPLVWLGRFLNEKCPHIYYMMDYLREKIRGNEYQ